MFGPKITHVFRSRWHALMWSAGVLVTAYCSVPTPDDSDNGTTQQAQASQSAQDQEEAKRAQEAVNAWEKSLSGK